MTYHVTARHLTLFGNTLVLPNHVTFYGGRNVILKFD